MTPHMTPTASSSHSRRLLAGFYVSAGVNHFVAPKPYERIVPPPLPPALMVQLSGVAEIAGGIGVLLPATRRLSGWGIVALLLAVFPANVYMAMNPDKTLPRKVRQRVPTWALWARLPIQPLLIWWARAATR
jgi:uncharacterized membrane protein